MLKKIYLNNIKIIKIFYLEKRKKMNKEQKKELSFVYH